MARTDAVEAVGRLMAAFRPDRVTAETLQVYAERLEDIEESLLSAAVNHVLSTAKFFPTIGEIREAAARIAGLTPPLPAEMLALIRKADVRIPKYSGDRLMYEERVWDWPEMPPATREALDASLAKCGDPCDAEGKQIFGWETGFKQVYEAEAAVVTARALADLSHARLPAPRPQTALPLHRQPVFEPVEAPDDLPIPMCEFCGKHWAFQERKGKKICLHCEKAPVAA